MVYFLSGVSQMEYDWAEGLRGLLDPCSRERLDTMKHPAARRKFLLGRGLLLYGLRREKGIGCLPPMKITGQGQPVFAEFPLRFSISHSGDAVMAGLHESAIGVDVEFIRPAYDARAAQRVLLREEIDALEKPEDFYACWTILESYEKARGTGIRLNGERKTTFPIKKIPHFDYEGYSFDCGNIGDMAYSICAEGEIPPLCIVKPEEFGALILE